MRTIEFKDKICNIEQLSQELKNGGYDIHGVSYDSGTNITYIHLTDNEIKTPSSIVTNHTGTPPIKTAPKTFKEQVEDILREKELI